MCEQICAAVCSTLMQTLCRGSAKEGVPAQERTAAPGDGAMQRV